MKRIIVCLCVVLLMSGFSNGGIRRIIIKEYPGATILPTQKGNEVIYQDLYDGRFIKVNLCDYRGKMHLQCYSKDSVLLEEGNYINSLALLRKQVAAVVSQRSENRVFIVEYYEPLRNGKWLFYDSTGRLVDSSFYKSGIKIAGES
jgi:antitoxin component YwqK of YwqJK toxin-antitoxin module